MLNSAGRIVGKNNGMRMHAGTLLSNAVFEPTVKIFLCSDSALFENGYRTSIIQTDIKKIRLYKRVLKFLTADGEAGKPRAYFTLKGDYIS